MNDGGPAFPLPGDEGGSFAARGMTLRDYFAAAAVNGLLAADAGTTQEAEAIGAVLWCDANSLGGTARRAYAIADAMLAERDK